jgi:protein-disulfide isomerase
MSSLQRPVDSDDHVKGPRHAAVTMVEYADFECPFCGQAFWELKQLEATIGDELLLVFRHFPLTQMHPHAMAAAEAAEAAGAQGRFWEMHDTLFANQRALDPAALMSYAADLQLDLRQFSRDLQGHRHVPRIRRDFLTGVRSGVNGTPTLFINGERYLGPLTFEALLAVLQDAPQVWAP